MLFRMVTAWKIQDYRGIVSNLSRYTIARTPPKPMKLRWRVTKGERREELGFPEFHRDTWVILRLIESRGWKFPLPFARRNKFIKSPLYAEPRTADWPRVASRWSGIDRLASDHLNCSTLFFISSLFSFECDLGIFLFPRFVHFFFFFFFLFENPIFDSMWNLRREREGRRKDRVLKIFES